MASEDGDEEGPGHHADAAVGPLLQVDLGHARVELDAAVEVVDQRALRGGRVRFGLDWRRKCCGVIGQVRGSWMGGGFSGLIFAEILG